ncbi:MAG TPA: DUF2703 domain-containing protein [Geobacteraceae bacterium]
MKELTIEWRHYDREGATCLRCSITGKTLQEVGARASENFCASCACLAGRETSCRTVEYRGKIHEEIPEELIRKAVDKVLGPEPGQFIGSLSD